MGICEGTVAALACTRARRHTGGRPDKIMPVRLCLAAGAMGTTGTRVAELGKELRITRPNG